MNRTSKYPREIKEKARRLALDGKSKRSIATTLKVPRGTLESWLAELSLPPSIRTKPRKKKVAMDQQVRQSIFCAGQMWLSLVGWRAR